MIDGKKFRDPWLLAAWRRQVCINSAYNPLSQTCILKSNYETLLSRQQSRTPHNRMTINRNPRRGIRHVCDRGGNRGTGADGVVAWQSASSHRPASASISITKQSLSIAFARCEKTASMPKFIPPGPISGTAAHSGPPSSPGEEKSNSCREEFMARLDATIFSANASFSDSPRSSPPSEHHLSVPSQIQSRDRMVFMLSRGTSERHVPASSEETPRVTEMGLTTPEPS